MTTINWAEILIPIFFSTAISFIITIINNRINKKRTAKKALLSRRVQKLQDMVMAIKKYILNMQYERGEFDESLRQLFYSSGDLQVYLDENSDAMIQEVGKSKSIYHMEIIDALNKQVTIVGNSMRQNESEQFAKALKDTLTICDNLIKTYNISLSDIEYM